MSASFLSLLDVPSAPSQQSPFAIFSWDQPFLEHVHAYIMAHCQGKAAAQTMDQKSMSRATIIMPHSRPRRYLTEIFQKNAAAYGPLLLPRMLTLEEVRQQHFLGLGTVPPRTIELLDSVHLLYQAVKSLQASDNQPLSQYQEEYATLFAHMDLATFLPWGIRLSTLFEEYMHQMLPVYDVPAMEGEVSAMAAALLGVLGRIHKKYLALLQQAQASTAGLNALRIAEHLQKNTSVTHNSHTLGPIPPLLCPNEQENHHVFFIGFSTLTAAEDVLLRSFWQQGAHICLHTDPRIANTATGSADIHWACQEHSTWMKRWNAQGQVIVPSGEHSPRMHFVAGYDVHSQLLALQKTLHDAAAKEDLRQSASPQQHAQQRNLAKNVASKQSITENLYADTEQSTAVVLTSPALLMPTLHHLPQQNFNVSMGYPLEKSSLFSLIEALLRLQENCRPVENTLKASPETSPETSPERHYHWRYFLHSIHHPFVQMLPAVLPSLQEDATTTMQYGADAGKGAVNTATPHTATTNTADAQHSVHDSASLTSGSLRPILQHMERLVRKGKRFVLLNDLYEALQVPQERTGMPLVSTQDIVTLKNVFTCLLDNFTTVKTTHALGEALAKVCQLLLHCGKAFWQRHPLDAESLYRLMQRVVPALKNSALAHEPLPQATLFALCRQCIQAERVPFEADPLQGLQVLGMLETRLLHFDKVLILDATDDALPGFSNQDPLLPEALRRVIGLPGLQERERVMAHTLHRLLASAKEVHFYWQEGLQSSGLLDDKKIRSRFVDTFLWEEEQQLGRIIEHNTPPLHTLASPVTPVCKKAQYIANTPEIQKKIQGILSSGISPTMLNNYLQCPYRFILQNIYKLQELDSVNEGEDAVGVGILLHDVLHQAYKPWEGKDMPLSALQPEAMERLFEQLLANDSLQKNLPTASLMLLRMAVPVRLRRYLQAQAKQIGTDTVHIFALEKELSAPISGLQGEKFCIKGKVDRVDKRCHISPTTGPQKGLMVLDYKTGSVKNHPAAWEDMDLWESIQLWSPTAKNSHEVLQKVAEAFTSVQLPSYIHMCAHTCAEPVLDAAWVELKDSGKEVYLFGDKQGREDLIEDRIAPLLTFVVQHMHSATVFLPHTHVFCAYCAYKPLCQR